MPCSTCGGTGTVERPRTLSVNIPKGIKHGAKIRLAGQGDRGQEGAPDGDLILKIAISSHEHFRRRGSCLESEITLSLTDVLLGTHTTVDTFWGPADLRIPAGTQPGAVFRLRGMGVEKADGSRGDHHVRLRIPLPRQLTPAQKELVRKLKETGL